MNIKTGLMFNCFSKKKYVLFNIKRKWVLLNKSYISKLIYTKEDEIYKINNLADFPSLNNLNNKKILELSEDSSNIFSNSNLDHVISLPNNKTGKNSGGKESGKKNNNDEDNNETEKNDYKKDPKFDLKLSPNNEMLNNMYNLNNKFIPSDYELQLYKNNCRISYYWIKKLNKLKNINAINCLEYLKDDNLLYYDCYKNKGLLKFLNEEKKKYSNCIILSRVGDFYETYGLDSIFLIEFLNIKKMNNKLSCGFIKTSINKALSILTNNNLNICIYEEMNEKSLQLKKRYLSQIVTPEYPIYLNNIQYYNSINNLSENGITTETDSTTFSNNLPESTQINNSCNKNSVINNISTNDYNWTKTNDCIKTSTESLNNSFFNSYDLDNYIDIKEIVCIYIESKNIFSLSKINLSLKTIAIYDNITFDVLNIYLKNSNFLKVYIHQHNNTNFTKKITQLFQIENYYLFNNFNNSLNFHMFILEKLKKQVNIHGLFRLIKNKSVFNIKHVLPSNGSINVNSTDKKVLEDSTPIPSDEKSGNTIAVGTYTTGTDQDVSERNINNEIINENNQEKCKKKNKTNDESSFSEKNNFNYSYSSYCTPLNIFTSYNMGIYKQNTYYENRNNYLFYNVIDVNNNDSKSINIAESLEFFKNLFLFYPPFEITKHIRYINEFIFNNIQNLIIPNVRPFRNNIVITLLSNFKADHNILKKILINIEGVLKCIKNYHFSFLVSIFHVLNHQNSFKLNIIKFYELLINIQKILKTNLNLSTSNFTYTSDLNLFNDFVYYHENDTYNIINDNILTEYNKDIEKKRNELLQAVLVHYGEYNEGKKTYDIELLNKVLKIDNNNDIIGIKKKNKKKNIKKNGSTFEMGTYILSGQMGDDDMLPNRIDSIKPNEKNEQNEQSFHFFHPLNKKSDTMKNIYVTAEVQQHIRNYLLAIDRKKKKINEIIKNINMQLSSSVHILSFVSNFLQIIQALYNHTINSIKRNWELPICKHLMVTYEQKTFQELQEKLFYMQKCLYNEEGTVETNIYVKKKNEDVENKNIMKNDLLNDKTGSDYINLEKEEKKNILKSVDTELIEEVKKIYNQRNYVNDSITYITGARPYNITKKNVIKYDVFLKKNNFILLTGENMSGKTTLSFTILCILFLANLGMYAPCNKTSIISKFREFYSLKNVNYKEQIENMSLFREQTYYINSIIEEIKGHYLIDKKLYSGNEVFILFDEPCIATTPLDNAIIISAIADYLKKYCGIIITHNYDLLKKIYHSKNIVFKRINENINYIKEQKEEGSAILENGICKNSEALETCRYTNMDNDVFSLLKVYEKKYRFIHNLNNILYYKFLNYIKNKKNDKKIKLSYFFDNFMNQNDLSKNGKNERVNILAEYEQDMLQNLENMDTQNILLNYNFDLGKLITSECNKDTTVINNKNENGSSYIESNKNDDFTEIEKNEVNINSSHLDIEKNNKIYEKELNNIINKIEKAFCKKISKIEMNEDTPIFFKNKSIVYILTIFTKKENKPYFYIGISDNISERLKRHTRNLLNNKSLLKNPKKNTLLNYKIDLNVFYTLLFHVDNKIIAAKYEKELTNLLKMNRYNIISK
ncbi:DNA mismatch repair protein, putative [Hepatocystis sp. ex Piliocolobus tephrosceles]|nr:DNA mismatch repair protein, putative [Hepatocystis sp. ex Piliocolobus tephrosceles]